MCGIAGFVIQEGRPSEKRLEAMLRAVRHRGPDSSSTLCEDRVALAHARLEIVGVGPSGHQPMTDASGRWSVACNGEIFNHRKLRTLWPDHEWNGPCDIETLVHGLSQRGLSLLRELNGFFALAAWDRAKQQVHLVRDRFGVKPLYYAATPDGGWAFASTQAAILAAGVPARLNKPAFAHHLARKWTHGRDTCLETVRRVLPGWVVTIDLRQGTASEHEWAPLGDFIDPSLHEELLRMDPSARVARVELALRDAVRGRLMADTPVAVLCSGGLDSSLTTAMAAADGGHLDAFAVTIVDQPDRDELDWAERVCRHTGAALHPVPLTMDTWKDAFVPAICNLEYPPWIENLIGTFLAARAVRQQGYKVLLGGEGADEVWGGYDFKFRELREIFRKDVNRDPPALTHDPDARKMEGDLASLLGATARHPPDAAYVASLRDPLREAFRHFSPARGRLSAALLSDTRLHLQASLTQVDAASMAHGVELREPFLEPGLVRLGINMPLECLHWPSCKAILKELALRWLPEDVVRRPRKIGFSYNPHTYLAGRVRPEFLERSMLAAVFEIPPARLTSWLEPDRGRALFRLLSGEIWLRRFIGGQSVDRIDRDLWA